jgi:hypothetical protein
MWDGLDAVGLSSMRHAYGPADEVPALLLALRSPDAGERGKALSADPAWWTRAIAFTAAAGRVA